MTDPREAKLPQWAQQLLEAERVKAALAWPTEPAPAPDLVFDNNGRPTVGERKDGYVYQVVPHAGFDGRGRVNKYYLRGWSLVGDPDAERMSGSRPEGAYYRLPRDAALALLWAVARESAKALYEARLRVDAVKGDPQ